VGIEFGVGDETTAIVWEQFLEKYNHEWIITGAEKIHPSYRLRLYFTGVE
jgi:hypothetical protein